MANIKLTDQVVDITGGGTSGTTAAEARANLNVVNKSGDTMSGNLTVDALIVRRNNDIDVTSRPTTTKYNDIHFHGKNAIVVGIARTMQNTDGSIEAVFGARRPINGNIVTNELSLKVKEDGAKTIYVTDPALWRTALGLEAVEFDLTRASAVPNGSSRGIYDPGSKTVHINGWAGSNTDIATGAVVFTVPAEYRPSSNKYGSAIIINSSGVVTAYTIGVNASGSIYQSYTNTARQIKFYIEYKL